MLIPINGNEQRSGIEVEKEASRLDCRDQEEREMIGKERHQVGNVPLNSSASLKQLERRQLTSFTSSPFFINLPL